MQHRKQGQETVPEKGIEAHGASKGTNIIQLCQGEF